MKPINTLQTIFIADTPDSAATASSGGADLIMVDLETAGKQERQKTLSAHFTKTSWTEVAAIRDAIPDAQLMIRLDPWDPEVSNEQIDQAVNLGADQLMLPMIEKLDHVTAFARGLAGRAALVPLVETIYSIKHIAEIAAFDAVDRIHIGLNDLHLQLQDDFLFEPLANGLIETAAKPLRSQSMPFGFGGIGSLSDTPPISPQLLLGEHARLASTWVILSRQFRTVVETSDSPDTIRQEISDLKICYANMLQRDAATIAQDNAAFVKQVRTFVAQKNRQKSAAP